MGAAFLLHDAAMTIISRDARVLSNRFTLGCGSQESAFAKLIIAIEMLTNGVRNPIRRQAPNPASVRLVKSTSNVRLPPWERYKMPWAEVAAPTTPRIKSRAAPGQPPGKAENSLCSVFLPSLE